MARRQQAAWTALRAERSSAGDADSSLVEVNLDTLEVFDLATGRSISHVGPDEPNALADDVRVAEQDGAADSQTRGSEPETPDETVEQLAFARGELNQIVIRGRRVIWSGMFLERSEFTIGVVDSEDPAFVLVYRRFGGGRIPIRALDAIAGQTEFSRAHGGLGVRPEVGIRAVIQRIVAAQAQVRAEEEKQRAKEQSEQQRQLDEAMRRIESRGGVREEDKGPRVGFDFENMREVPTGPIDPEVARQLREARRRAGNRPDPVFVLPQTGPGTPIRPITEEEARGGTEEEIFSLIRRELRQIVREERGPLDRVQLVLDLLGLIPALGVPADFLSGTISAIRGDKLGVALAITAMAVDAAGVARILRALAVRLDRLDISAGLIKKIRSFSGQLDRGELLEEAGRDIVAALDSGKLTRAKAIQEIQKIPGFRSVDAATEALDTALAAVKSGQRSGLQVIFRRGMKVRIHKSAKGGSVPIYGKSASSSTTPGHAATIDRAAERMAASGDYSHIVIGDRSLMHRDERFGRKGHVVASPSFLVWNAPGRDRSTRIVPPG